MFLVTVYLD